MGGKKNKSLEENSDQYFDLLQKCEDLEQRHKVLEDKNSKLEKQLSQVKLSGQSQQPLNVSVNKDDIPKFEAKIPASNPLQRNSEVESWLRRIELHTIPATDEYFIKKAKSRCSGSAELLINSSVFENISSWSVFKDMIRKKFRGTFSPSDFFKHLQEKRLGPSQSPHDFYIDIQGAVLQGERDYPRAVGDSSELIKRIFLQGLPVWMRELLASHENDSPDNLVEIAARIWNCNSKMHVSRQTTSSVATVSSTANKQGVYCAYHRVKTHSTSTCRSKPHGKGCWTCGSEEHRRNACPFPSRQLSQVPTSSVGNSSV